MDISQIEKEYSRRRMIYTAALKNLAAALIEEAAIMDGTDFEPQAHWKSHIAKLSTEHTTINVLSDIIRRSK